jgi:predicted nucleic acid-binding protein
VSSREPLVAVLDANVLYGQFLRDVLLRLADAELFLPRWTDEIQQEWMRNLLVNIPDFPPDRIHRTGRAMEEAFPDARVLGYRRHEKSVAGIDPKDRHVAAAAIAAGAQRIVTFNLRHFPLDTLAPFGITPIHPDAFVGGLISANRDDALAVLDSHRRGLTRPPLSPARYREMFIKAGLKKTVRFLPIS